MLDATQVAIAANGTVSIAPIGTTLPTDATTALDAAFKGLGYIGEDGVSFSPSPEVEGIKAWQSLQAIRQVLTGYELQASFDLLQWNEDTLTLAFGGGQFTDNLDGTWDYLMPKPGELTENSLVIDAADGTKSYRIVLDKVVLSDTGDITFDPSAAAGFPVTLDALAGFTEGRPGAIYLAGV